MYFTNLLDGIKKEADSASPSGCPEPKAAMHTISEKSDESLDRKLKNMGSKK